MDPSLPFLVDTQSASIKVTEDDLGAWADGQSVFVSSLIGDMHDERAAARTAIEGVGATPKMFEFDLGAQDVSAGDAYLDGVRESSIYVGVFGTRYGQRLASRYSATEEEFKEAERGEQRLALFVTEDFAHADGGQTDFVGGIRQLYTTASYASAAEITTKLDLRLRALAAEELAPWVILGQVAFRATRIVSEQATILLTATLRNGAVATEVMGYRGAGDLGFAGPHESRQVRVQKITSTSTSTIARTVEIELRASQQQPQSSVLGSVNGISSDELLEIGLGNALFGRSDGPGSWATPSFPDPLAPLRTAAVGETALRPLARLVIGDVLRRNGIAGGLDRFVLSPRLGNFRELRLRWSPPRRYLNQPAGAPRELSGQVSGL